jgi:hypothetical protein
MEGIDRLPYSMGPHPTNEAREPAMKIGFVIGETEQHQMELDFDQISGDLTISMDGAQLLHDSPRWPAEPSKKYELNIGDNEKHKLSLQLTFGDEPSLVGFPPIPRLMVTAFR